MDSFVPGSQACAHARAARTFSDSLPLFLLQVCFDINGQLLDMCLEKEAPSDSCNALDDIQAKTEQGKAKELLAESFPLLVSCKLFQTGGCDARGAGRDLGEARDGAAAIGALLEEEEGLG